MQQKERFGWLDIMKLIGVYFVYLAHTDGMGRFGILAQNTALGILFFASGFSAGRRKDKPLGVFVVEKAKRILIPYFAFSFLALALKAFVLELPQGEIIDIVRRIFRAMRNDVAFPALWFLPCLFLMSIYYQVLMKWIRKKPLLLAASLLISCLVKFTNEGPYLPWGIELAGRFLIYYSLGDCASVCYQKWRQTSTRLWLKILLGGLTLVNFYVFYTDFYFGRGYFPSLFGIEEMSFNLSAVMTFLLEINGIWCAMAVALVLQAVPGLCRAGRHTLAFCGAESIVKLLVPLAFEALGFSLTETGGAAMLLQEVFMMLAAYYLIALPASRYFPWMLGTFETKRKDERTSV